MVLKQILFLIFSAYKNDILIIFIINIKNIHPSLKIEFLFTKFLCFAYNILIS